MVFLALYVGHMLVPQVTCDRLGPERRVVSEVTLEEAVNSGGHLRSRGRVSVRDTPRSNSRVGSRLVSAVADGSLNVEGATTVKILGEEENSSSRSGARRSAMALAVNRISSATSRSKV
jgi:hypothetical protein